MPYFTRSFDGSNHRWSGGLCEAKDLRDKKPVDPKRAECVLQSIYGGVREEVGEKRVPHVKSTTSTSGSFRGVFGFDGP